MTTIINTTLHPITFRRESGEEFTVEPCGVVINATIAEEYAGDGGLGGVTFVRSTFNPSADGWQRVYALERENPAAVIVGSVIAAQAYPGHVFGLVAAPGYERAPVAEKRMSPSRFVTFAPPAEPARL